MLLFNTIMTVRVIQRVVFALFVDSQTVAHDSKIDHHLFSGGSPSDGSIFFSRGHMQGETVQSENIKIILT